jgi:hypothetical protein
MEKFKSGMIDVPGCKFFSPVRSRYVKFMEHYAIVMQHSPLLAGIPRLNLLPSLYYIRISAVIVGSTVTESQFTDSSTDKRTTVRPMESDRHFVYSSRKPICQVTSQLTTWYTDNIQNLAVFK